MNIGLIVDKLNKIMSQDVEFNEWRPESKYERKTPRLVSLIIKYSGGLVRDEKQANYVLLSFVVLLFFITIIFLVNVFGGGGVDVSNILPA